MSIQDRFLWLSRRAFLGGSGTLLAMPFLESLTGGTARAQTAAPPPKRFLAWYFACGVPSIADWKPAAVGMTWEPSLLLTGLTPVKSKVSVLSNLRNVGKGPDHTYGTGAFLTGKVGGTDPEVISQSIDQVIADALSAGANRTQIHSLQLGVKDMVCEPNGPCSYLNNISYGKTGTAIPKEVSAANAFNRLFAGTSLPATDAAAAKRLALRKSVLDAVNQDATSVNKLLSKGDQIRFDEYLSSVRRVELQVASVSTTMACPGKPAGLTASPTGTLDVQIDAFNEVMSLAFECDLTRVITFMMTSGATGKSNITTNGYHLDITHRGVSDWLPKFRTVVTWEVKKFAELLARLESKKDFDGVSTILDNTAAFCSSEISGGNEHNHDNMPVLLGGSLGGTVKAGQHKVFSGGEYFADLYMFIAKQMGVPLTSFGSNGTGKITAI
jgi:hypothetical protein